MTKRKTTEQFILESNEVHDSFYDYSLAEYIRTHDKVKIKCPKHGMFEQRPNRHLQGDGCPKCADERGSLAKFKTTNQFIQDCIDVHGNVYDYSFVDYNGLNQPVTIKCMTHGLFKQRANDHLHNKAGCPQCGNIGKSVNKTKSTEQFISDAVAVHGATYDYSLTEYTGSDKKVTVLCSQHGAYEVTPSNHLSRMSGCPKCNQSKGEQFIFEWLKREGIHFEIQISFNDCKSKKGYPLRFDFYIPSINTLIEYDGPQHFGPVNIKGCSNEDAIKIYENTVKNDNIKDLYVIKNDFNFYRIGYQQLGECGNVLKSIMNRHIA